jgi:hypothetical protein
MKHKAFEVKDVLLCDDIRVEENKKLIYIGVYPAGNVIIIGKIPFTFPKLSFVIKIRANKGEYSLDSFLKGPNGKTIVNLPNAKLNIEEDNKEMTLFFSIVGVKIENTGLHIFESYEKDEMLIEYKFQVIRQNK